MTATKQLAYKSWLDELNTTPSEAFFPTFRQFFDLLIKDNPTKIQNLLIIIKKENGLLSLCGREAISDLEPLLDSIEAEAKKEGIESLPEVVQYRQVKDGQIRITGQEMPDTLYHAIRLSIEQYRNVGKLKMFDHLMSVHDNLWYVDYVKACSTYPSYKHYKEADESYQKREKEEPWGAYNYLKWASSFFKDVLPEQAGSFVKPEIINSLRRLILYLITPDITQDQTQVTIPLSSPEQAQIQSIPKDEVVYRITYTKRREILLNNEIRIANPDFDSENDVVFEYIYMHPDQKLTKEQIEQAINRKIGKSFHKILENLNFAGNRKRAFFSVSSSSILFRNPITRADLTELDIESL